MSELEIRPSHVALLVRSVDRVASFLKKFGFQIGPAEMWEGEGTMEIYVEPGKCNSLLLLEPAKPGAYQRAMGKRGPCLHHIAIDVLNLEEFVLSIASSGWLLHPNSVKTIAQSKTAYLARPGFPALIEAQEKEELSQGRPFVSRIEIPFDQSLSRLLPVIGLDEIVFWSSEPSITLDVHSIPLGAVLNA